MAPTSPAAPGPSSTAAASVADELGDHLVCRDVSGALAVSQMRNSAIRTPRATQGLGTSVVANIGREPAALGTTARDSGHHHDADIDPGGQADAGLALSASPRSAAAQLA